LNVTKIKEFRKKRHFKLTELSEKTGYTPSYLSQLERGIKKPSLEALRKISDCLDIPMFELISEDIVEGEEQQKDNQRTCDVIFKDKRKKTVMPQILTEYEFVTPYAQNKTNQPQVIGLITTILPGHMACEKMVSHQYEESVFILKGRARVYVDDEMHELSAGDSIYIYANVRNNFENCGDEELVMLGYASQLQEKE
jgi:transcriptional regulator with XRE-family HTH domain